VGSAANVKTLDTIVRFRAGLAEFADDVKLALSEAQSDVQKTVQIIQMERLPHWTTRVRKLQDKVQQAKSELYRAEVGSREERPSCVLQRKALAKAKAELEEAERKVAGCKRWIQMLDREGMLFRAALAGISTTVELEVPNALAHMDRLLDSLSKYLSMAPPADDPRPLRTSAEGDRGDEAKPSGGSHAAGGGSHAAGDGGEAGKRP